MYLSRDLETKVQQLKSAQGGDKMHLRLEPIRSLPRTSCDMNNLPHTKNMAEGAIVPGDTREESRTQSGQHGHPLALKNIASSPWDTD